MDFFKFSTLRLFILSAIVYVGFCCQKDVTDPTEGPKPLLRISSENTTSPSIVPWMSNGTCLIDFKAYYDVQPAKGKTIDDYKFHLESCERAPGDQPVNCQKVSKIYPDCSGDCTEDNEFDSNIMIKIKNKRLFLWVRMSDRRNFPIKDYPKGRFFIFRMIMTDPEGTSTQHPESEPVGFRADGKADCMTNRNRLLVQRSNANGTMIVLRSSLTNPSIWRI